MNKIKYWFITIVSLIIFSSCEKEAKEQIQEGNPSLEIKSEFNNVHFGDILPFEIQVNDDKPLSMVYVNLYFGEEIVSKTSIRTKDNGSYSGNIEVPFLRNIPDGTATLEFILINTTMKKTVQKVDVPISRAKYPYLILVTDNGSYPMQPTDIPNEYRATEAFTSTDLPAYIKTPTIDEKGTEILFGWDSGSITNGVKTNIPFVSPIGGSFSVTFNIMNYEASPFFEIHINDVRMSMVDKDTYTINIELEQNKDIVINGLEDISSWWIDSDYLTKVDSDNKFSFVPITGAYRITANLLLKYFKIEALDGSNPAKLNDDGTGAIWIIGQNIGKPSVEQLEVGWDTSKAICMAPIGNKKYQITVKGGETISTNEINFKFFHQSGWGKEFKSATLTTNSDIIFIGDGDNGRDDGNLGLIDDIEFEEGSTYILTIDVSKGIDHGELTITKK